MNVEYTLSAPGIGASAIWVPAACAAARRARVGDSVWFDTVHGAFRGSVLEVRPWAHLPLIVEFQCPYGKRIIGFHPSEFIRFRNLTEQHHDEHHA